jgi:hypothetical protein
MKSIRPSRFRASLAHVALLASVAAWPAVYAETSAEYMLKVYRETYAQLCELGLRPAEAAAEARKVAKDDAAWERRQHEKGVPAASQAVAATPTPAAAIETAPRTGTTSSTQAPAAAPVAGQPLAVNKRFSDERTGPAVPVTPATARPLVLQAASEQLAVAGWDRSKQGEPSTPAYDRLMEIVQTNRLVVTSSALLKDFENLTNSLAKLGKLKRAGATDAKSKDEENAAEKKVARATDKAVGNLNTLLSTNTFSPKAFLHVGYLVSNPYSFASSTNSPGQFELGDSNSSAAYVEFQYNNRWAWNWTEPGPEEPRKMTWVWPGTRLSDFDLQTRFGYSFVGNDETEISSVVGGGNINGEFNIGSPFLKYQNDWLRYSANAEVTYGATSDRSDFDIHSTFIGGIGYHASMDSDLFPGKVLLSVHIGTGFVEIPDVVDPALALVSARYGRPNFINHWGTFATTFETMLPLNRSTYIVAGGRLYANASPNPWTAYIGISRELGSITSILSETKK